MKPGRTETWAGPPKIKTVLWFVYCPLKLQRTIKEPETALSILVEIWMRDFTGQELNSGQAKGLQLPSTSRGWSTNFHEHVQKASCLIVANKLLFHNLFQVFALVEYKSFSHNHACTITASSFVSPVRGPASVSAVRPWEKKDTFYNYKWAWNHSTQTADLHTLGAEDARLAYEFVCSPQTKQHHIFTEVTQISDEASGARSCVQDIRYQITNFSFLFFFSACWKTLLFWVWETC